MFLDVNVWVFFQFSSFFFLLHTSNLFFGEF